MLWDPQRIADDLAMNMARPVHWQEAMVAADERDARLAIEMPPGGVLTCLTRRAGWRGETIALERSGTTSPAIWRSGLAIKTAGVHPSFRRQRQQVGIAFAMVRIDDRDQLAHLVGFRQL